MAKPRRCLSAEGHFCSYLWSKARDEGKALDDVVVDGLSLHERFAEMLTCTRAGVAVSAIRIMCVDNRQSYHRRKSGHFARLSSVWLKNKVGRTDLNRKLTKAEMLNWLYAYK